MKILAKSRMAMLLVMVAASGALFAQSSGPDKPQSHASVLDARQIVGQSVAATERSWQARDHYAYTARDEERRLDLLGHVKSEKIDVTRMIIINGARFEQPVEHNGAASIGQGTEEKREDLDKLKHETPDERAARAKFRFLHVVIIATEAKKRSLQSTSMPKERSRHFNRRMKWI